MNLTSEDLAILEGDHGKASQKAMQILVTLGKIYGAERLIPVASVQIAGVSYANLGEAGLAFLEEMAQGGGKTQVLATLNPAGMDVENWTNLGIEQTFAENQQRVLDTFARMGVTTTCTCTPYLIGNLPLFGQHLAWAESSAVAYANSVIGARSNREGGPSALAAALTGRTPAYGYHLDENRKPSITVAVRANLDGTAEFGALGKVIGERLLAETGEQPVPYIQGIGQASLETLKSFCASIATYGGVALFHMAGITPEAALYDPPQASFTINKSGIRAALAALTDADSSEVDFLTLGCPHLSIQEVAEIARLLEGKQVTKELWITTARPIKQVADRMGYTEIIQASGAKIVCDTCCVVAPIKGRFRAMGTDSVKACYYGNAKNGFQTKIMSFVEVIQAATGE